MLSELCQSSHLTLNNEYEDQDTKNAQPFGPWESALIDAMRSSRPHTPYLRCITIFLVPRLERPKSTWRMRQSHNFPVVLNEMLNNTKNSSFPYIRSTRCLPPAPVKTIPAGIPAFLATILRIPHQTDPPFRFKLTPHSGKLTP